MPTKPPHPCMERKSGITSNITEISRHFDIDSDTVPLSYPYDVQTSPAKTRIPFCELRGNGPPPLDIGHPGDIYLDLAKPSDYALYSKGISSWARWPGPDPNPLLPAAPPAKDLISHPHFEDPARFLWCNGVAISWYARNTIGKMRGKMRTEGLFGDKDCIPSEHEACQLGSAFIRKMIDNERRNEKRSRREAEKRSLSSTPEEDACTGPENKKAKICTESTTSGADSKLGDTHYDLPAVSRFLDLKPNQDARIEELIQEKKKQESEIRGLQDAILELIEDKEKMPQTNTGTSSVQVGTSTDDLVSSAARTSRLGQSASASVFSSSRSESESSKALGYALQEARLETQRVRLELDTARLEVSTMRLHAEKQKDQLSSALEEIELEKIRREEAENKASVTDALLVRAQKDLEQSRSVHQAAERKYTKLSARMDIVKNAAYGND